MNSQIIKFLIWLMLLSMMFVFFPAFKNVYIELFLLMHYSVAYITIISQKYLTFRDVPENRRMVFEISTFLVFCYITYFILLYGVFGIIFIISNLAISITLAPYLKFYEYLGDAVLVYIFIRVVYGIIFLI